MYFNCFNLSNNLFFIKFILLISILYLYNILRSSCNISEVILCCNFISTEFIRVGKPIFEGKVSKKTGCQTIIEKVKKNDQFYIRAFECAFPEWEKTHGEAGVDKLKGSIRPDDCFINEKDKIINWLECKSQNGPGSVAEKLQTGTKKIRNLKRRFPGWNINYYYILDAYFRKKAKAEIADLDEDGIPYIWNDDQEFEKKILNKLK